MNKRILITLVLLAGAWLCKGQMANPGSDDLTGIKTLGIRIVLDDSASACNKALSAALLKYWTVCPYESITHTEAVEQKGLNPDKYLLTKITGAANGDAITVLKAKDLDDTAASHYLAQFKLNLSHNYTYAMPNIVQELNREMETALAHPELQGKPASVWEALFTAERRKHIGELKTKTLYILKPDFNKHFTEESLKQFYTYRYKVVSEKELADAVNNQDADVCYLFTWPNSKYSSIIDAKDGYLLYAGNTTASYFTTDTLRDIVKQAR